MEETNRQLKIAGVLQKDLVDVLQKAAQDGMRGVIISVSKVSCNFRFRGCQGIFKCFSFGSERRNY